MTSDSSHCFRFAAVVELEMALTGNPDKKMLMRALARRRDNQFDNFFDRLITELFITGTMTCFAFSAPVVLLHVAAALSSSLVLCISFGTVFRLLYICCYLS